MVFKLRDSGAALRQILVELDEYLKGTPGEITAAGC